jgi:DNA-binding protein HU-beta
MNKAELVDSIAHGAEISKSDAKKALDAMLGSVSGALKDGGQVSLVGFGTFSVRDRAERTARNPKTQEVIQIPATKVPAFKAGKALKEAVN